MRADPRPVYFLQVPRASGRLVGRYLDAQFRSEEICPARSAHEFNRLDSGAIGRYRLFQSELGASVLGLLPADTAVVTFARDPLARAISHWRMVRRTPAHPLHAELLANDSSFEWFLGRTPANPMTLRLSARDDAALGGEWNPGRFDAAESVDRAIARLESCAVVGLAEKAEESIGQLAHRFGWAPPRLPPPAGAVRPVDAAHETTERDREFVAARDTADFAVHTRAVELFERRSRIMGGDLRQRLHERRLAADASDLRQRIVVDVGARAAGAGWLASASTTDGGAVRRIAPATGATIDLPIRLPRFTKLEMLCLTVGDGARALVADDLAGLAVSVNGEPVLLEARAEPGAVTLHGVVPRGPDPWPFTRIELGPGDLSLAQEGPDVPGPQREFSLAISTVTLIAYDPQRLRATTITSARPDAPLAPDRTRVLLDTSPAWVIDEDLWARLEALDLWVHAEELQRDGYTVVPDVLPPATIARARDLILRHAEPAIVKTRSRDHWLPFHFDPLFTELFLQPVQLALADLVCGKGMLASCAGLVRDGRSHPSGLHTENAMYLPAPFPQHNFMLSSMLTCDDFNRDAGGTCFVPGSHLSLTDPPVDDSIHLTGAVPADAPAGSLVLWLGGTWHGTYQRMLPGERVSLLTIFTRPQLRPVQDLRAVPERLIVSDDMRLRLRRGDLFERPGNESPPDTFDQLRWVRGQPKDASTITLRWGETLVSRSGASGASGEADVGGASVAAPT